MKQVSTIILDEAREARREGLSLFDHGDSVPVPPHRFHAHGSQRKPIAQNQLDVPKANRTAFSPFCSNPPSIHGRYPRPSSGQISGVLSRDPLRWSSQRFKKEPKADLLKVILISTSPHPQTESLPSRRIHIRIGSSPGGHRSPS